MDRISSSSSLQRQVYDALRDAVLSGELQPGSLHSVNDLAGQFGVSRTPVREAGIKLAASGMVRFERNRGIRILESSWQDIEEVFELRLLLEVPGTQRGVSRMGAVQVANLRRLLAVMEQAARDGDEAALMRRDREFHRFLLAAAGNRRLVDFVDSLRDLVLTRGKSTAGRSRTLMDIVDAHRDIFEKVEAGDAAGAAACIRRHIVHTGALLLAQEPDYLHSPGAALRWAPTGDELVV